MGYIPNTDADRSAMLAVVGASSTEELFVDIPDDKRGPSLEIPPALSEFDAVRLMRQLGALNADLSSHASFLGAGAYSHFIPSIVSHVTGRSEFYTAYTPYQPEISQGTLQTIYEYQSMICGLTGMEVANASMYDGASAMAEAVIMATVATGRKRVIIAGTLHPDYRATVRTYLAGRDIEIVETPVSIAEPGWDSRLRAQNADVLVDETTACLCVQQPNFLGAIEDLGSLAEVAHRNGALLVTAVDPIALGLLETPGAAGADIVVGEGQPLGIPVSYGGPYLGLFATREKYVRQMPGRIVGETVDVGGRRGFVLTLQTREQHIRRERATSNICTNQALCALAATVYLATLGKNGMRQVADLCLQKAHYAAEKIASVPGFSVDNVAPFFKEFVVRCPAPVAEINRTLLGTKIVGGFDLGRVFDKAHRSMLVCVTETITVDEIDRLVEGLQQVGRDM